MLNLAIDDEAKAFYAALGFIEFPIGTRTLYLPVETIARRCEARDASCPTRPSTLNK